MRPQIGCHDPEICPDTNSCRARQSPKSEIAPRIRPDKKDGCGNGRIYRRAGKIDEKPLEPKPSGIYWRQLGDSTNRQRAKIENDSEQMKFENPLPDANNNCKNPPAE